MRLIFFFLQIFIKNIQENFAIFLVYPYKKNFYIRLFFKILFF